MIKILLLPVLGLLGFTGIAQQTIAVHFLYGSVPEQKQNWIKDSSSLKYTSVIIPVNDNNYSKVRTTLNNYLTKSPYDYAVFGMRCAAATYDVLEETGILRKRSRLGKWISFFYPQLLRRRLLKVANANHFTVVKNNGRMSRKWEKE